MKAGKTVAMILVIALVLTVLPVQAAAAEKMKASVVFEASEQNGDGCFTMSMAVYNAKFNTFQFVLRYDESTVIPVDSTGAETSRFFDFASKAKETDWMETIGTKIDPDKGLIDFTGYVTPGRSVTTDGLGAVTGYANIGTSGIEIFTFNFKKIGSADVVLEIATESSTKPYSRYLPEGGALYDAGDNVPLSISFNLPAMIGKSSSLTPVKSVPETVMTVKERLKDTIALQIGNYGAAADGTLMHIDPENNTVTPYIDENGRTMIPVRFIAEQLGADIGWDPTLRQVTITLGSKKIIMTVGSTQYKINGRREVMDTAPVINAGWNRTMVPIRFVAEALGMAVEWDHDNKLVLITPAEKPWQREREAEREATDNILLIISTLIRNFAQ